MSTPNQLPPFLQPLEESKDSGQRHRNAVFPESRGILPVHVHWWPCRANDAPRRIFIFIPGNPGVIEFYTPFLDTLYNTETSGRLAILTFSHVGHAPSFNVYHSFSSIDPLQFSLASQLQNALRVLDALRLAFGSIEIVLAGHSVGAWLALQLLKARGTDVSRAFLLFPTIAEIANSPNGRKLSWLFQAPLPRIIASISAKLYYLPIRFLGMMFPSYPRTPLGILHSLVRSSQAIFAALTMAHDEMIGIRQLDVEVLRRHKDKLWFYFAEYDDWVGEQKSVILHTMGGSGCRIVHGESGVPHAFCINHSEQIARQCCDWLEDMIT